MYVINSFCSSFAMFPDCVTLPISPDPGLQTVAVVDSDVSEDVPRVGLEEMLQDMTITDRRD